MILTPVARARQGLTRHMLAQPPARPARLILAAIAPQPSATATPALPGLTASSMLRAPPLSHVPPFAP